jgi:NAD+ diphosphatase
MAFTANPLDRMERTRTDDQAVEALRRDPTSRFVCLANLEPLVETAGGIAWRSRAALAEINAEDAPWVLLGQDDQGRACFAVDVSALDERAAARLAGDAQHRDLRSSVHMMGMGDAGIMAQARSLIDWHNRHGFCAVCGQPTTMARGGAMRRCSYAACAAQHFPRVDPVAIMLVVRDDKCLMGRQSHFPPGMYSALAGFIEPGETMEDAVRREVMEEAGIRVGRVDYVMSQPWPFPSSLMIGCVAEGLSDEITIDEQEIETARWITKSEAAAALKRGNPYDNEGEVADLFIPPPIAIAYHLLREWVEG